MNSQKAYFILAKEQIQEQGYLTKEALFLKPERASLDACLSKSFILVRSLKSAMKMQLFQLK